jgi:hypothetical protein
LHEVGRGPRREELGGINVFAHGASTCTGSRTTMRESSGISGCPDSPRRKFNSPDEKRTDQESFSHALPTFSPEDPDLALIVGLWDRLADEIRARLVEIVRENLPILTEDM